MVILGYAALAGLGFIWAMSRSPLGRAVGLSISHFAYDRDAEEWD